MNRLAKEASLYLRQHAHNPVDWHPWGDEAFELARERNCPIFLSVGYSTCHWCHVMERESFEDEGIAALLNEHFVSVKVDREERPDVDDLYMKAVQAMTRQGGWPMTVVLDLERRPVFAATYLPARDGDRGSHRGLASVLQELRHAWDNDRSGFEAHGARVAAYLRESERQPPAGDVPGPSIVRKAIDAYDAEYDERLAGFGNAPKFPTPSILDFLLRAQPFAPTGRAQSMAVETLVAMGRGGIHDQIGGGFHRYSVDAQWRVPHFEKMLYDNAQLLRTSVDAWQATAHPELQRVIERTASYLLEEMKSESGPFFAATDADSLDPEGNAVEGWFFTWTPDEVAAVLGTEEARIVYDALGIREGGDLDGRSVPHLRAAWADSDGSLRAATDRLLAARAKRPAPHLDDKFVAAWNGLAIAALARAGWVMDRSEWLDAARDAARFICTQMSTEDGRFYRCFSAGQARHTGMLEDQTFMALGLHVLFESTGEREWLERAVSCMKAVNERFADGSGGWYRAPDDGDALLVRSTARTDGAEPSGTAVGIDVALRLGATLSDPAWEACADGAIGVLSDLFERFPTALPAGCAALSRRLGKGAEVAIVWPDGADGEALLATLRTSWRPFDVSFCGTESAAASLADRVPWLTGKSAIDGKATAYVCSRGICARPTTDPAQLREQLAAFAVD